MKHLIGPSLPVRWAGFARGFVQQRARENAGVESEQERARELGQEQRVPLLACQHADLRMTVSAPCTTYPGFVK